MTQQYAFDIDGSGDAHYGYRLSPLKGAIYCPLGLLPFREGREGVDTQSEVVATLVKLQVQPGDFLSGGIGAGRISDDLLLVSEHNLFLYGDEIADDYRKCMLTRSPYKICLLFTVLRKRE